MPFFPGFLFLTLLVPGGTAGVAEAAGAGVGVAGVGVGGALQAAALELKSLSVSPNPFSVVLMPSMSFE